MTYGKDEVIIELPAQEWEVCRKVDSIPGKYDLKEDGKLGMHCWETTGAEYRMVLAAESTEEN